MRRGARLRNEDAMHKEKSIEEVKEGEGRRRDDDTPDRPITCLLCTRPTYLLSILLYTRFWYNSTFNGNFPTFCRIG